MESLFSKVDFAIIDLGSIEGISDSMTDRRWTTSMIHWSCERADDLWIVSKNDVLGIHRLQSLVGDFSQITIRPKLSLVLNTNSRGRKGRTKEDAFIGASAPLRPQNVFTLPRDSRTMAHAEEERATLVEVDDRSVLRKGIAKLAVGLIS